MERRSTWSSARSLATIRLTAQNERRSIICASMAKLEKGIQSLKVEKITWAWLYQQQNTHPVVRGIAYLITVANSIICLRHFPTQWKCGDVIVLQKPVPLKFHRSCGSSTSDNGEARRELDIHQILGTVQANSGLFYLSSCYSIAYEVLRLQVGP